MAKKETITTPAGKAFRPYIVVPSDKFKKEGEKRGVPITWTNTLGMPILQSYPNYRSFRLETRLGDSIIKLTLREAVENSLDKSRQRLGVAPNFIHSLDASAMMLSIVKTFRTPLCSASCPPASIRRQDYLSPSGL